MTFQVPWVISDVDEVPLEVARLLAYIATNGKEGVVGPGDLLVRATSTPGANVRVAPGSFAALNNFPGNSQQTYLGQNNAEVTTAVTATGGSTRSDMVYVRINDTGQTGGGTSGAAELVIEEGVSPSATTLADVDPNIAGVALARIDMPTSTATVQQAYITDLRELVSPKRSEVVKVDSLVSGDGSQDLTSATFVHWPNLISWSITIPTWAVRVQLIMWLSGYRIVEGGTSSNVWGELRGNLGSLYTANVEYNHSTPDGAGTIDAAATMVAGDIYIPVADRGDTVTLRLEGKRSGGANSGDLIRSGWGVNLVAQLIFYEDPDASYWG